MTKALVRGSARGWLLRATWAGVVAAVGALAAAPATAAGWQNIGPQGGAVISLAVDPTAPATVYAATATGVWKTVDAGSQWLPSGPLGGEVTKVAADPAAANTVFAVTGGLDRSTDGGASWQQLQLQPGPPNGVSVGGIVSDVAFDPRTAGTLYAAAGNQVVKSIDDGDHWVATGAGLPDARVTSLAIAAGAAASTVYAGTFAGMYRSADGGASWQAANSGAGGAAIMAVAVDPSLPGRVYALPQEQALRGRAPRVGVLISTDGGANWFQRRLSASSPEAFCLAVPPSARGTVYGCGRNGIYRSQDGGFHWQPVGGLAGQTFLSLGIAPSLPSRLYAGDSQPVGANDVAVLRSSTAGDSWQPAGGGLYATPISNVAIDPSQPGLLYATAFIGGPLIKSADDGSSWQAASHIMLRNLFALAISPAAPATLYAATSAGVAASDDGAAHWSLRPTPFHPGSLLLADPGDAATVYASGLLGAGTAETLGLYASQDSGATWRAVVDAGTIFSGANLAGSISPPAPQTIYVVATVVTPAPSTTLFVSHDGTNFEQLAAPDFIQFVVADPVAPATMYCGPGKAGLYKSVDGGRTLMPLQPTAGGDGGFAPVASVAIDPTNPALVYAGSVGEVLTSRDGGQTWGEPLQGLPAGQEVSHLYVGPTGTLYAMLNLVLYRYDP
jgi:hypothetical protein